MQNSRAVEAEARGTISNSPVSRIPKWCPAEKLPPIHSPLKVNHKPPTFFTHQQLSGIPQPPLLGEDERRAVLKAKAQRKELDDHLKGNVAQVEHLKKRLHETKCMIEKISTQLSNPDVDSYEFAGGCDDPTTIIFLAKENLRLQRDLLENLDLEEKFTGELEIAQRELWGAGIADHYLSMDVEEKLLPAIDQYEKRKSFMAQKRALREKVMKRNAEMLRKQTLSKVVKSMKQSVEANSKKSHVSVKVLGAKNARKKVDHFIRKTMLARQQQKLMESADEQLKQDRQQKLLGQLKQEMDDQKDTLIAMSQAKQKKDARIAAEKEKIRQEFASSGKNPYYVEHLLAIEEKRAGQQRKMLEIEQERLTQLQRDYEITEKAKKHEEIQKKKWDRFWTKKLEERKKALHQKEIEFYDDESTTEHTATSKESLKDYTDDPGPHPPPPSEASMSRIKVDTPDAKRRSNSPAESGRSKRSHASSSKPGSSTRLSNASRTSSKTKTKRKSGKVQYDDIPEEEYAPDSIHSKKRTSSIKKPYTMDEYEDIDTLDSYSFRSDEYEGEFYDEESESQDRLGSNKRDSMLKSDSLRRSTGDEGTIVGFVQTKEKAGGDAPAKPKPVYKRKPKFVKKSKKAPLALRWQPNIVTFSDYEVGKTYKKILSVTNVSRERVKFFLKDFIDLPIKPEAEGDTVDNNSTKTSITDVVHVNFQVSKTLSPGLSHDIYVIFAPSVLEDWKGLLKFESSNEPFEIPIHCFKKRFVPVLSSVKAVFTNIVANTSAMISIKLTNTGVKAGVISQILQIVPGQPPPSTDTTDSSTSSHPTSATSQMHLESGESHHKDIAAHHEHHGHTDTGSHSHQPVASHHSAKSLKKTTSSKRGQKSTDPKKGESAKLIRGFLDDLINSVSSSVFIAYVKECKRDLETNVVRTISLIFRPPNVDTFKSTFEIYFEDPEVEKLTFKAVGASMENPIHLDPLNTDFRICMMDHNYQQLVTVSTTIRGAGKVSPEVPKELRPYVEVSPKEVTVFAKNPGKFSVKFRPTPQMLANNNPALQYVDTSSMIIDFPVSFHLKFPYKLSSPLTATFLAVLTNQALEFFPEEIDMGKCSSIETVQASFTIFNNCMLPQQIGFVEVPDCISIQPNYGFATLLPYEKREFSVMLSLPENSKEECIFILKCQTLQQRQYVIPVRVLAKTNNIHLSQTRIFFPVTAVGSVSTTTIEIFSSAPEIRHDPNPTKAKFEFHVAPHMPLTVLPRAGYVEAKKPTKILVRFEAQVSEAEVRAHLLKMLEKNYIESHAMLQRELDGINETLKYEMVFSEGDFDEEFMKNLTAQSQNNPNHQSELKKRKSRRESVSARKEKRSSYVQRAPTESNIRLSIPENSELDPIPSDSKPNESVSRRKSKAKDKRLSKNKVYSERIKKNSLDVPAEPSNKRGSSEPSKRKPKNSVRDIRGSEETDESLRNSPSDPKMAFMFEAYKVLEKRRDELVELLAVPYNPPKVDNVETESREFSKAKKDLIKHLETSSHIFSIPCFVTDPFGDVDVHLLIAKCPMSHPSITLLEESNIFDFGAVAIGSRGYREVHLYNVSHGALKIKMDVLNPYGPFVQCNALRKVPPDHVFTLKLRFQPEDIKNYEDTVRFFGGDSCITITLRGAAVEPQFNLKPTKSEFYVGTIKVGAFGFQEFEINNSGSADLEFTVDLLNQGYYEGTSAIGNESGVSSQMVGLEQTPLVPGSPVALTPPPSATRMDTEKGSKDLRSSKNKINRNRDSVDKTEETIPENNTNNNTDRSRKSRTKSIMKRRSRKTIYPPEKDEKSKSIEDPTFEIKDGEVKHNFNIKELLPFLEQAKKQYFFQAISDKIKVPGGSSKKFTTFFVPVESGRYFAEFQIRLYQKIVHRFCIVGVGQTIQVSAGEGQAE